MFIEVFLRLRYIPLIVIIIVRRRNITFYLENSKSITVNRFDYFVSQGIEMSMGSKTNCGYFPLIYLITYSHELNF